MNNSLTPLLERFDALLERLEPLLPPKQPQFNIEDYSAFSWKNFGRGGYLQPIEHPAKIEFENLHSIDRQIGIIKRNTEQFLSGYPANNMLLTGARGTGKSSLVKATLAQYQDRGLKVIEIESDDLHQLPLLLAAIESYPHPFILFCDDLSFEDGDSSYKPLKALLDGSLSAPAKNILLYATSNRRHLLPEYMEENRAYEHKGGEVHASEASEEKISLSERFGLWVSFYPFTQSDYLNIIRQWLEQSAPDISYNDEIEKEALQFSLQRGSRSGRVAHQFVKDYIGSYRLDQQK